MQPTLKYSLLRTLPAVSVHRASTHSPATASASASTGFQLPPVKPDSSFDWRSLLTPCARSDASASVSASADFASADELPPLVHVSLIETETTSRSRSQSQSRQRVLTVEVAAFHLALPMDLITAATALIAATAATAATATPSASSGATLVSASASASEAGVGAAGVGTAGVGGASAGIDVEEAAGYVSLTPYAGPPFDGDMPSGSGSGETQTTLRVLCGRAALLLFGRCHTATSDGPGEKCLQFFISLPDV